VAPAVPLWVFSGAPCLGSPVGSGWEELERRLPLCRSGLASALSLEKPVLGSCWILGVTRDAPAEVWWLTKGDQAALGFWGLGTGNNTEANLGMETVSTIN